MNNAPAEQQERRPEPTYLTFTGEINQDSLGRLCNLTAIASQQNHSVHLLFQSTGG